MSASKPVILFIAIAILSLFNLMGPSATTNSSAKTVALANLTTPPVVTSALNWLATHQYPNGSYGQHYEGQTAAAAYALWLNNSASSQASASYSYLASQLGNPSAWFWLNSPEAEADVPGLLLYSLAVSQHLGLLANLSSVSSKLLQFQQPSGGFEGYHDLVKMKSVTSSVDTAMVLWALSNTGAIPSQNRTAAVDYLLRLQNQDGSFNLTSKVSTDPVYSLGPDSASITGLITLVLRDNGFTINNPIIQKSLDYLSLAVSSNFNGDGHVYSASLSGLAFMEFYRPRDATRALVYLVSQQKKDGGFVEIARPKPSSNPLDTGWAASALLSGVLEQGSGTGLVNQAPRAQFDYNPHNSVNGTTLSFDASTSSDSDGDTLVYYWSFGTPPSPRGRPPTHAYARDGNYTVTLTVTDNGTNPGYLSSTTWQIVTVTKSTEPARTAGLPLSSLNILELAGIFVLAALLVGSLAFRMRKRRKLEKIAGGSRPT